MFSITKTRLAPLADHHESMPHDWLHAPLQKNAIEEVQVQGAHAHSTGLGQPIGQPDVALARDTRQIELTLSRASGDIWPHDYSSQERMIM